jgi:hypothetical protein
MLHEFFQRMPLAQRLTVRCTRTSMLRMDAGELWR